MTAKTISQPNIARSSLDVDGLHIQLVRSTRRRTLTIEVSQQGIKARAPMRMRESGIIQFVRSKRDWIDKQSQALPAKPAPLRLVDGCQLKVLGEAYALKISSGRRPIFIDADRQLVVPISNSHLSTQQTVQRKLVKWYKQVAQTHLDLRVKNQLAVMVNDNKVNAIKDPNIKVRDYKRRWGSCDHRGDLSFNWRIVMASESVLDYIILHELAHLREFNHSPRFWKIVEHYLPDWREPHQWLNQHGAELYRF